MSANIYWRVDDPGMGNNIGTMTPSSFIGGLERAFNESLPISLEKKDLPVLRGMAVIETDYDSLVDALEKHEKIRIWAEH